MNEKLIEIARQVEELAVRYNVAEASAIVRPILDGDAPMLIVANDLELAAPFRAENFPCAELLRTEELLAAPWRALSATRIVAVYKCGEHLSVDATVVVEQMLFPRPRGSYAFVFLGCAGLDSSELELVERSAWRLLVPEPKPRWTQQDLGEHNIYFWASNPESAANQKSQQALDALRTLEASQSNADSIIATALSMALDRIQAAAEAGEEAADTSAATRRRLINLLQEMKSLARRLTRHAEREVELFSQTMDTSALRLRSHLNHGLRQALRGNQGVLIAPNRAELRQHLQHHLDAGAELWLSNMRAKFSEETGEMVAEAASILRATDWSEINRLVSESGQTAIYPASITDRLTSMSGADFERPAFNRQSDEPPTRMPAAGFAIGGTGLLVGLGFFVGPVTAIVTSVLLGAAAWKVYQERGVHDYEVIGAAVILGVTEQMRVQTEERANSSLARFKAVVDEEFQRIDQLLMRQISRGTSTGEPQSRDLETLSSLRSSLGAWLTTASAQ